MMALALWSGQAFANDPGLQELLKRSTFASGQGDVFSIRYRSRLQALTGNPALFHYDAVTLSIAASLYSRSAPAVLWESAPLQKSNLGGDHYFNSALPAYFRKGHSDRLYVILPGVFSTSEDGSFVNSVVGTLDRVHGKGDLPNVLYIPGIYTTEFMGRNITRFPWNQQAMARDIYQRIRSHYPKFFREGKMGVIGSSGGATLAIHLLAEDTKQGGMKLGALSLSPLIDTLEVLQRLDDQYARLEERGDHKNTLTGIDYSNLITKAFRFLRTYEGSPTYEDVLLQASGEKFNPASLQEMRDRFVSEIYQEDLGKMRTLTIRDRKQLRTTSLRFLTHIVSLGCLKNPKNSFQECRDRTSVKGDLGKVTAPLFIFLAQDDPVAAADPEKTGQQPPGVASTLAQASLQPHITVFNPLYGGHAGIYFDEVFDELVEKFFHVHEDVTPVN